MTLFPYTTLFRSDLELRNISLLLRWWWKSYKEPNSLWTVTVKNIRWQGNYHPGPMLWSSSGSFFWGQLLSIKHIFAWATQWIIGDGRLISYWYDNWGPLPIANSGSRQVGHSVSLRQARVLRLTAHQQFQAFPQLTDQLDELLWRFSSNGQYSSASVYKMLIEIGRAHV